MRRKGLILACAVILATNAFTLAGVAYNRSGEPLAEIVLTQRELKSPYRFSTERENTGLSLKIAWNRDQRAFEWLDPKKLEDIGFTLKDTDTKVNGKDIYRKTLVPRVTFAVLQMNEELFSRHLQMKKNEADELAEQARVNPSKISQAERAQKRYEKQKKSGTRLFIIDLGNDPKILRERYPDRALFMIIPAEVHAYNRSRRTYDQNGKKRPTIYARVKQLLPGRVHVPRQFQDVLYSKDRKQRVLSGSRKTSLKPQYEVVLRFGKRYEPWIEEIRPAD